jgi:hypothetical protein
VIEVLCRPCTVCGERSVVSMDESAHRRWVDGAPLQEVCPEMSTDERELLISGTHGPCWDSLFDDDE